MTPRQPVLAEPVTVPLWRGHLTCHIINTCSLCPFSEPGNDFASLMTRPQKVFLKCNTEPPSTGSCDGTWQPGDGATMGLNDLEQSAASGIALLVTAWP